MCGTCAETTIKHLADQGQPATDAGQPFFGRLLRCLGRFVQNVQMKSVLSLERKNVFSLSAQPCLRFNFDSDLDHLLLSVRWFCARGCARFGLLLLFPSLSLPCSCLFLPFAPSSPPSLPSALSVLLALRSFLSHQILGPFYLSHI